MATRCRIVWVVAVGTAVLVGGPWEAASAQGNPTASLTSTTTPYEQNFDILRQNNATLLPNNVMPGVLNRVDQTPFTAVADPNALTGWRWRRGSTATGFQRGDGSLTTGQGYSYGNEFNDGEAALGVLTSGSNTGSYFGLIIRNNTGTAIPEVTVTYVGEQWRFGGRTDGSADRLEFGYALNSNELPGTAGTTAVPALNFNSIVTTGAAGAIDGNAAANRVTVTGTIALAGPGGKPVRTSP
jgi:hypothetical protein